MIVVDYSVPSERLRWSGRLRDLREQRAGTVCNWNNLVLSPGKTHGWATGTRGTQGSVGLGLEVLLIRDRGEFYGRV